MLVCVDIYYKKKFFIIKIKLKEHKHVTGNMIF